MKPVASDISFPGLEKQILEFWKEQNVFQRSLEKERLGKHCPSYVFYDGPPFATGLPHYGHLLAGTIKDVIGRYFTMKGYQVDRRLGWDCHGVPVEMEIQKALELHGSKAIKEFGIDKFNEECRSIVNRYTKEWVRFIERSGRWVDVERQYQTMDTPFMESVWWAVKELWDKGLIYESFKCVSYSPAMSTPISNFEANLNYKQVQDPSVTARAKVLDRDRKWATSLDEALPLVMYLWTTTPWTLPSNTAAAVNSDLEYLLIKAENPAEYVLVAKDRAGEFFSDIEAQSKESKKKKQKNDLRKAEVVTELKGSDIVGLSYEPFFDFFEDKRSEGAFRVFHGDFVTSGDGTGIVHLASFGEEDLAIFLKNNLPIIDPIDPDGAFTEQTPPFSGLYFKDADPKVLQLLKDTKKLVRQETIEHSYPFCWRTDTPLMYKSISTWFVKVEAIKEQLLKSNSEISWVPDHLKQGRFGMWLENARDWAISRNRFWGTPIPIWKSESGRMICIGSVEELEKYAGVKVDDLHTHFVDQITFKCPETGETMRRIPEILDCWFESGAMPYAQAHYPFEGKKEFEENFPADFIAEGLDQTRGWFYTLLVLSSALFEKPAFKNVIVNGIILAEDGKKMSKSLRNYPPADTIMDSHGADAMRLYLLSSPATRADELRFSEAGVRDVVRQTLIPFWNAYKFFVTYAEVDGWTKDKLVSETSPNLLDQWILSKLASTADTVDGVLGSYRLYQAAQPILHFIDQLTNWYIRLNRRRFWAGSSEEEKRDKNFAYSTLYQVLTTFSRILAPLAPFVSEEIYRNLLDGDESLSVHLSCFPTSSELSHVVIDKALEEAMELFEETIVLGRALRNEHEIKVRQPLGKLTVVYNDISTLENLKRLDAYIRDELNIKSIEYVSNEEAYVSLTARLNTVKLGKTLGPKLGKEKMGLLVGRVTNLSTDEIRAIESGEPLDFEGEKLGKDDILISRQPREGLTTAASSGRITIVLDTALSPELRLEGLARELVNRIQKLRKDSNFEVTDRIVIRYMTACTKTTLAMKEHNEYILGETLAVEIQEISDRNDFFAAGLSEESLSIQDIDDAKVVLSLQRIQS